MFGSLALTKSAWGYCIFRQFALFREANADALKHNLNAVWLLALMLYHGNWTTASKTVLAGTKTCLHRHQSGWQHSHRQSTTESLAVTNSMLSHSLSTFRDATSGFGILTYLTWLSVFPTLCAVNLYQNQDLHINICVHPFWLVCPIVWKTLLLLRYCCYCCTGKSEFVDRTNKIRNAFTGTKGKGFPFLFVSASKEFAFGVIRMTPLWQYTLQRRKCIGVLPTWIMYVYMLAIFQCFFLYARVWNEAGSCLCWHSVYRKTRPLWSRWSIWFWVVSHGHCLRDWSLQELV